MNCFMVDCIEVEALSGYEAAIVCSMDQVERPSSSTSGGHSDGSGVGESEAVAAEAIVVGELGLDLLIIDIHAIDDVHCRHGFPSLSSTTPLASFL